MPRLFYFLCICLEYEQCNLSCQSEPSAGGGGDDPLGPEMDKTDLHDQYTQQQKLILQLKAMIRERGEVLETKDKEIKVSLIIREREGRFLKLRTRKSR